MAENNAETTAVEKKTRAKKTGAPKPPVKERAAKKQAGKTVAKKAAAKPAAAKQDKPVKPAKPASRPAGKKGKKGKKAKQFAYMLLTAGADGAVTASQINGPFATEHDALDDASIMADESTTIVVFREIKRGRVQKSTKFVNG